MGEAKRRKQQGAPPSGLPDALLVRNADIEAKLKLPFVASLHLLSAAEGERGQILLASRIADGLMAPEKLPAQDVVAVWAEAPSIRECRPPAWIEIKRRLAVAPVVIVTMLEDADRCWFRYLYPPRDHADELNGIAAGLAPQGFG